MYADKAPLNFQSPRRCGMQEPGLHAKLEEKDAHIRELGETIEVLALEHSKTCLIKKNIITSTRTDGIGANLF